MTHSPRHRSKTVLFCPGCGHESPIDGDWSLGRTADRVRYGCPDCDRVVADRPSDDRVLAAPGDDVVAG